MSTLRVRLMTKDDWEAVLAIHRRALPDSLMCMLGPKYLRHTLYPLVTLGSEGRAIVVEAEGRLCGFAMYGASQHAITGVLKKHWGWLLLTILRKCLKFDYTFMKFFVSVLCAQSVQRSVTPQAMHLFLIAVDPSRHGQGLGSLLLQTSLPLAAEHFSKRECVVEARTEAAQRFYEHNGFTMCAVERLGIREYVQLKRSISS